ncbi:hypothetical protein GOV10_02390 [Candidatus Woesearchaeota archaeon]|nr:hypothetical protein [Candidatus Woesearchaeota archaeon]
MNVMMAWRQALKDIKDNGVSFTDDEGRECLEVLNYSLTVHSMEDIHTALQLLRGQKGWYYPSDEELKEVLFNQEFEESNRYAYGPRIFRFREKLNQLDGYVIPLLRSHPDTRRALVTLADPVADDVTHLHNYVSLLGVWFRMANGRLCVTAMIRSNDFVLGWPANLFQIKLLQEYVAERVGADLGAITTISLSAHLFLDDDKLISGVLGR